MSDETQVQAEPNVDEVQPINPVEETQNVSRETIRERPENVPEKFWNADTGEVRTDDLLKSNAHLEQFVGGKKDELKEQIINEFKKNFPAHLLVAIRSIRWTRALFARSIASDLWFVNDWLAGR